MQTTHKDSLFDEGAPQFSEAATEEGGKAVPFQLTRFEAILLMEAYVRQLVEYDVPYETMQLSDGTTTYMSHLLEVRLNRIYETGQITVDQAKSRYKRLRQLRGLDYDTVRQERE